MHKILSINDEIKRANSQKTVVVGMSGGVDSSLSALLCKEWGYRVIGLFMKNWEDSDGLCRNREDFEDVIAVCDHLKIPYHQVDFVNEYWQDVFVPSISAFKDGLTPNPDILCNKVIKFDLFFKEALKYGADFLATGHYCQIDDSREALLKGHDDNKEQTYFLYTIKKEILKKVLFPVGGLLKSEVRQLALHFGIKTYNKKDSTGICFIGERNFAPFLSKYIENKQGPFIDLKGDVVGHHMGAPFYTIGQRKGLGLGGAGEPWYVLGKDIEKNIVYVTRGEGDGALLSSSLMANTVSWVSGRPPKTQDPLKAKIRYRQADQECILDKIEGDNVFVSFKEKQRAVAPGQSIVFYQDEHCLGGAVILKTLS